MKIFVILLILLVRLVDLVISRGDKITGYSCSTEKDYSISFSCDESPKSVGYVRFTCNKTFIKYFVEEVSLDCSMPTLDTYFSEYFKGYHHMKKLNLSNIDLSSFGKYYYFEQFPELLEINLSHNKLTSIPFDVFEHNWSLRSIDLSFNQISKIAISTHFDRSALTKIDIPHMLLTRNEILNRWPNYVSSLSLDLSHNQFQDFDSSCLPTRFVVLNIAQNSIHMTNLTLSTGIISLHAAGSRIDRISVADNLMNLKHLNVSGCGIQNMDKVIAKLDSNLHTFDASFNFVGELSGDAFSKLESLEYLSLKATNLTNAQFTGFHHHNNLKTLDISFNNLKQINFTSLGHAFDGLKMLYVDGNELSRLDGLLEINFPKLEWIGLSQNNFSCDYLIRVFGTWNRLASALNDIYEVACHPTSKSIEVTLSPEAKVAHHHHTIIICLLLLQCIIFFVCFIIIFRFFYVKRRSNYSTSEQTIMTDV